MVFSHRPPDGLQLEAINNQECGLDLLEQCNNLFMHDGPKENNDCPRTANASTHFSATKEEDENDPTTGDALGGTTHVSDL